MLQARETLEPFDTERESTNLTEEEGKPNNNNSAPFETKTTSKDDQREDKGCSVVSSRLPQLSLSFSLLWDERVRNAHSLND